MKEGRHLPLWKGSMRSGMVMAAMIAAGVQLGAHGAAPALPVKDGRPAVASVNGKPISLDELLLELEAPDDQAAARRGTGTPKALELLDRLVNVRLILQEATTMGLAEQPEIRKQVEVSARGILRDVLLERVVKDVVADPATVQARFEDLSREWKASSLLFKDEASATRVREELAGGAKFAEVAARESTSGAARASDDGEYHTRKDFLAPVALALSALKAGEVSPVVKLPAGFVVITVSDLRYPESTAVREQARRTALAEKQVTALQAHEADLRRRLVTLHDDVLKAVDYTAATPGLEALRTDKRVLAEIKGAASVTVGDLTEYLRLQSFHGPDQSAQGKRMNASKGEALDATIGRRVLNHEATRLGLDQTAEYRDRVRSYEDGLVFDAFVQKVIVPDSKMTEDEVKAHYESHRKDYSSPEMVRLRGLAFTTRAAAEDALDRLRGGAEFSWLAANAEGQVPKGAEGVLELDGRPLTTASMPEGMQTTLNGAKTGDARLYEGQGGRFYVLSVQGVVPPEARPYDEVREDIAKELYAKKLRKNVEDYLAKLRTASTIEIYLGKAQ
jgi:hypothetical protein